MSFAFAQIVEAAMAEHERNRGTAEQAIEYAAKHTSDLIHYFLECWLDGSVTTEPCWAGYRAWLLARQNHV